MASTTWGQIVGLYFDSSGAEHGFSYNGSTYTPLNDPSGTNGTAAYGINDAGQIVGVYYDSSVTAHGFLYNGGNYTTLDGPSGNTGTIARGINDAGQIVGYYFDSNGNVARLPLQRRHLHHARRSVGHRWHHC